MAILYNVARSGGYEFDRDAPVMQRLRSEIGVRSADGGEGADLYGEPWTAVGGQIQGQTPDTEGELNDFFRTKARQWVNQPDKVTPGELADIMTGSAGRFEGSGGKPFNSVNLVANHDGYTVFGTVCNTDPDHHAWDHGGDPVAQRQAWRNLVALQLLAYGVPQLPVETARMWQGVPGNHNPYNIDADANYTPWSLSDEQRQAQTFLSQLMHFRQEHPELRPRDYASGGQQVEFFTPDGVPTAALEDADQGGFWNNADNHWLAYTIRGQDGRRLLVATNKHWEDRVFQLPPPADGRQWRVVLDTSARNEGYSAGRNFFTAGQRPIVQNNAYELADRSIVVLSED
jgi:glycogen operon protein